ncbi:hypothetical protein CKM354_000171300 [Cercospora kikuchii]|uniref:Mitochondrial transcription factor 1 n=1 Tax=Cercospora kikuchii TaxID=84275 RepID=A0A9P3CGM9_9PEZI|nr:uncharacterized protein CKM354_000171300 [Cercospora kikuchii]GIZ38293.1 hypothetical protein CKM354_000171300 [Cercospora kikuchii]
MSKAAQRLLRTPNELSNKLRVVFTPVVTPVPSESWSVAARSKKPPAWAAAKNKASGVNSDEANSARKQTGGHDRQVSHGADRSEKNGPTQLEAGRVPKPTRRSKPAPRNRTKERTSTGTPQSSVETRATSAVLKAARNRPEVVSEQLMDDVLEYLAPTLEQYKGCTIIDLHPGSCLWSRKVHNLLRPKCHLLLEPESQYQEYVDDLLNEPQSTYKHIDLPGAMHQEIAATYNQLFQDDGPIPVSNRASNSGPLSANPPILVIGSLNRRKSLKYSGKSFSGSVASIYHFCYGALVNDYMHRSGPVRMLLWTPEQDRIHFLPQRAMYRNNSEATVSMGMHVQTAVAVEQIIARRKLNEWSSRSRWSGFHLASEDMVRARAEQYGMKVPEGRQLFQLGSDGKGSSKKQAAKHSPYEIRYETKEQVGEALDELLRRWNERTTGRRYPIKTDLPHGKVPVEKLYQYLTFPELADALCEDPSKSFKAAARTRTRSDSGIQHGSLPKLEMESSAWKGKPGNLTMLTGTDVRIAFFADAALCGISLELHCKILEDQGIDVTELKKSLVKFADTIVEQVERKRQVYYADFHRLVDDWTSFFAPSQLLMADRRHYEPLQADPADFNANQNLCLLDCIPTNCDLEVPGLADRPKAALACRDIINFLYQYRGQSVTSALEKLAPNASTDLVNLVPAITDPRKGGRLDPKHLKVRQLTCEMLEGLTRAWFEWPFKPDGWEVSILMSDGDYSRTGSTGPLTPEAVTASDDGDTLD